MTGWTDKTVDDILEAADSGELPKNFGKTQPQPQEKMSSRDALVALALDAAIEDDLQERLLNGSVRAAVIDVAEASWADPVGDAIEELLTDTYVLSRYRVPKPKDLDDGMMLVRLKEGRAVVGVAPQSASALPPLLLSISEVTIVIPHANAEIVAETIRRCQPGVTPEMDGTLDFGVLTFDEITAIIDGRTDAARTVDRLHAAIARKNGVQAPKNKSVVLPRLEHAIEYGAARDWALALKDDIADYRSGRIGWNDVDRGCVLHGPPGTGKTLLAQMLGEACGVPVVVSSLGQLFAGSTGYLNDMIQAMRAVFDEAKAKAPSILFLDEINALPNADTVGDRNRDYWMPLILDFYQQLDGAMQDRTGVIVIGATNRIQDINAALLRPGRLERAIFVGPPDVQGIERIMRHHLGDDLLDVDLAPLSVISSARSSTGAVVMEQVRAARRIARRAGRPMILADLECQVIGEEHRTEDELRRAAVHEAGHVVVGLATGGIVESVSIMSGATSGGSARMKIPAANLVTGNQLEGLVMSLLAGRAAEQLVLGEASQGAGGDETSDLAKATSMLAGMEASLGLGTSLLFRSTPEHAMVLLRDQDFRRRIDKVLRDLYQRTIATLHERRPALAAIINGLLEHRFLTGEQVLKLIDDRESILEKSAA
jgi:hypothetical protein